MKDIKDILELYDRSSSSAVTTGQNFILRNGRKINQALSLFSDEESKFLYGQVITYCAFSQYVRHDLVPFFSGLMTSDEFAKYVMQMTSHRLFNLFEAPELEGTAGIKAADMTATFLLEQYRYKDIVRVEEDDVCIDGGAFIGDTAMYFTEGRAQKIYSFEIDKRNLKCLKNNIANFGKNEVVEIVEKALGARCGTMRYVPMPGNVSGGSIAEATDSEDAYEVPVTTIDAFCEEQKIAPDFIKMDIEGTELDALDGARKTIQKCRPKLAVCIYHKWEHHWEIPILVHELCPEYKLYLKKSQPYSETVLFAAR